MAGGKEKQERSKASRTRKRTKRVANNAIWNHALIAIVVAVIGVVGMAGLVWWQLVLGSTEFHRQQQANLVSQAYAGYFNGQIQEIRTRTNALASATETIDALISNDPDAMAQVSERLTQQNGYARRIQIFPMGKAQMDAEGPAPISFAALDLIQRAEKAPFVGPEISKSQESLVFVAQPILHDGVPRGVLFVALDRKGIFYDGLSMMGDTARFGQVRILQNIADGSGDVEVFSYGTPGTTNEHIQTQLIAPHWSLSFEPNYQGLSRIGELTNLFPGGHRLRFLHALTQAAGRRRHARELLKPGAAGTYADPGEVSASHVPAAGERGCPIRRRAPVPQGAPGKEARPPQQAGGSARRRWQGGRRSEGR
ncbi:MAG: hypothetical protein P8Y69_09585 [Gammaproteobacteria bacterium]